MKRITIAIAIFVAMVFAKDQEYTFEYKGCKAVFSVIKNEFRLYSEGEKCDHTKREFSGGYGFRLYCQATHKEGIVKFDLAVFGIQDSTLYRNNTIDIRFTDFGITSEYSVKNFIRDISDEKIYKIECDVPVPMKSKHRYL